MVRDFDGKLRLTAALLGVSTRKGLAGAFHRVNPATTFDLERAAKWLQGRAHPREQALYADWAAIVGLDRPLAWLLECDLDAFASALGSRHGVEVDVLTRRAAAFGRGGRVARSPETAPAAPTFLCGRFVSYRHAFSPYYRGRILRASLSVEAGDNGELVVSYEETLPTGPVRAVGAASIAGRSLFIDVASPAAKGERGFLSLFMPQPPASCLAGIYCGTTLISPHAEPACSRLLAVRIPDGGDLQRHNRYLAVGESLADDLIEQGMRIDDPAALDGVLDGYFQGQPGGGVDQITATSYYQLVAAFDRIWIASVADLDPPAAASAVAPGC
ncbi:MAG: hypothetical protein WAS21_20720 [Geminicoccaceae bacterium]